MKLNESLLYSYSNEVAGAFIIRLKNNALSEQLAERCAHSCNQVGMPFEFWNAFDGTSGEILVPEEHQNQSWLKLLKFTSYKMTTSEIACAISHISLWIKCIELDAPIAILEHDAVLQAPYKRHAFRNSGCVS